MSRTTPQQKEAIEALREVGALSADTALSTSSADINLTVALNLVRKGVVNIRLDESGNELFWLRDPLEKPTGLKVAAGFIVILHDAYLNNAGKPENFFLARTKNYDLTQATFHRLMRGWLRELGLTWKDVLVSIPIERISYNHKLFSNPAHIIVES